MAVSLLLLMLVLLFAANFMRDALGTLPQAVQRLGETPVADEQGADEEKWVAPTQLDVGGYVVDPIQERVVVEASVEGSAQLQDEDELVAVPINETPEELADSAGDEAGFAGEMPPD